eukprot:4239169-Pleurochrysis_carterae.AAC.2
MTRASFAFYNSIISYIVPRVSASTRVALPLPPLRGVCRPLRPLTSPPPTTRVRTADSSAGTIYALPEFEPFIQEARDKARRQSRLFADGQSAVAL